MRFMDLTPFPALCFRHDSQGDPRRVVVMRATFDIAADGRLRKAEPQPRLNFAERGFEDVLTSALRDESHLAPFKEHVDLVVHADAYAPQGRPAQSFHVGLSVEAAGATLLREELLVTGPRRWRYGAGMSGTRWKLQAPEATTRVPLRFDYSYGGTLDLAEQNDIAQGPLPIAFAANPVGRGFFPSVEQVQDRFRLSRSAAAELREGWARARREIDAPQICLPGTELEQPEAPIPLAGWGYVAKHWESRLRHAGTFDQAWFDRRRPLLPLDFDRRYWNGAHPHLQLATLPPDATIVTRGLVPFERAADQVLRVVLPGLQPVAHVSDVSWGDHEVDQLPRLDTVVLDLVDDQLTLLYRMDVADTLTLAYIEMEIP